MSILYIYIYLISFPNHVCVSWIIQNEIVSIKLPFAPPPRSIDSRKMFFFAETIVATSSCSGSLKFIAKNRRLKTSFPSVWIYPPPCKGTDLMHTKKKTRKTTCWQVGREELHLGVPTQKNTTICNKRKTNATVVCPNVDVKPWKLCQNGFLFPPS